MGALPIASSFLSYKTLRKCWSSFLVSLSNQKTRGSLQKTTFLPFSRAFLSSCRKVCVAHEVGVINAQAVPILSVRKREPLKRIPGESNGPEHSVHTIHHWTTGPLHRVPRLHWELALASSFGGGRTTGRSPCTWTSATNALWAKLDFSAGASASRHLSTPIAPWPEYDS